LVLVNNKKKRPLIKRVLSGLMLLRVQIVSAGFF
jgi:hypothetical protein